MYLEHFQLQTSPFREAIDPEVFFSKGGRDEILQGLKEDIQNGKLFVKLIGAEGTGKTLMCNVLLAQLPAEFEVVLIDNPSGSFDDLLQVICLDLGMEAGKEPAGLVEELKRLLLLRKEQGKKVVFMLDGAEKIFLATLERLLRQLCELEQFTNLTLLLSGRPGLNTNLEQLTVYCTGVDIHAGFTLKAMTAEETGQYLVFRLLAAGLSSEKHEEVFSAEAVEKIFSKAGGNPRLTNILAEEALQKSCSEKSFMVLLDHVDAETDTEGTRQEEGRLVPLWQQKKKLLTCCVGGAAVFFLLILLFSSKEVPVKEEREAKGPTEISEKAVVAKRPIVQAEAVTENTEVPAPAQIEKEQPVPVVTPEDRARKRIPGDTKGTVEQATSQPVAGVAASRNGEELFQERLRASASWLAGAYRNEYTIQLMMLASGQAAANVRKLLVQDEYYAVKDELHILRKKTTPPTLFVFYGTYASMEAARQVRNQMPVFLRKHHPYALSIADALTKTED